MHTVGRGSMMGRSALVTRVSTSLGEALPLLGLMLVSAGHPTRKLLHVGAPDRDKLAGLTALGRDWLQRRAGATGDDRSTSFLEDGPVLGCAVADAEGTVRAVLLAVLADGERWTDRRRPVLGLAVEAAGPDLLRLIGRPRPVPQDARTAGRTETELAAAADRGELVLLYQPEIDMRTGAVLAVEALLRWDHPERGRLGPDLFIGVAERTDMIKMLGDWVIDRSLRDLAGWDDDRVTLRINVSPAQLGGDGVVGRLEAALRESGVPAARVGIEFTETAASGSERELADTLRALDALGVGSSIDDLAAGYSTLSRLRTLPVDTVKIDRSLVQGLDRDDRARAIVRGIMTIAAELGLEVVGEGVETPAEAEALLELGCHRGQGHLFGRAQSAAEVTELLARRPDPSQQ